MSCTVWTGRWQMREQLRLQSEVMGDFPRLVEFRRDGTVGRKTHAPAPGVGGGGVAVPLPPVPPVVAIDDDAAERVWWRYTGGELASAGCGGGGGETQHHALHECALALASDYDLLDIALWRVRCARNGRGLARESCVDPPSARAQHGHRWTSAALATSLDHSIWFHAPLRADDWVLFDVECPRAAGARALLLGRMWTRDGTHVATVAQEGLLRMQPLPPRPRL